MTGEQKSAFNRSKLIATEIVKTLHIDDYDEFVSELHSQYRSKIANRKQYSVRLESLLAEYFYELDLQNLFSIRPD